MNWDFLLNWEILSPVIIVTMSFVYVGLERLFPATPGQAIFRKGFFVDMVAYGLVQSYFLGLLITWFIQWLDNTTGWSQHGLVSSWPVWVQVLFFLVTHDLYIYLFHRWQHHNKYLWRIHEAHHSVKDVDWMAGTRSHAVEIMINQTIEFAPIALLGATPEVALIKATIDAVWGMYIHSNIDVRSGWLQRIINGPEMHRWHHARRIMSVNFSTKLAIWDWMFGTAYLPDHKPEAFGLVEEKDFPEGYLAQHAFSLRPFKRDRADAVRRVLPQWLSRV